MEKGLGHLFIISSSSHFNETDFNQDIFDVGKSIQSQVA